MTTDPTSCVTSEEGIGRVLNKDYAFLGEGALMEYYTNRHCDLMVIGKPLNSINYAIAVPKGYNTLSCWLQKYSNIPLKNVFHTGSEYRETLNNALLELAQLGKLELFKKKWWVDKNNAGKCSVVQKNESEQESLHLSHIGGIFIVLLAGLGISIVVALIENTILILN